VTGEHHDLEHHDLEHHDLDHDGLDHDGCQGTDQEDGAEGGRGWLGWRSILPSVRRWRPRVGGLVASPRLGLPPLLDNPLAGHTRYVRRRWARAAELAETIRRLPSGQQDRAALETVRCPRGKLLYRVFRTREGILVVPGPRTRTYASGRGWCTAFPWFLDDHADLELSCRCCNKRRTVTQ
jgi:hypothetical protein